MELSVTTTTAALTRKNFARYMELARSVRSHPQWTAPVLEVIAATLDGMPCLVEVDTATGHMILAELVGVSVDRRSLVVNSGGVEGVHYPMFKIGQIIPLPDVNVAAPLAAGSIRNSADRKLGDAAFAACIDPKTRAELAEIEEVVGGSIEMFTSIESVSIVDGEIVSSTWIVTFRKLGGGYVGSVTVTVEAAS